MINEEMDTKVKKTALVSVFIWFLLFSFQNKSVAEESGRSQSITIPYKISSHLWHYKKEEAIPTPLPLIQKIQKAFELWGSVTDTRINFQYAGLAESEYNSTSEIPHDGSIYVVLNSVRAFKRGVAGTGSYQGSIPKQYDKGFVFLNTRKGLYTLKMKTLLHEIGHALGLSHTATNAAVMCCGTPAWGDHEFFNLSEQDRADLILKWNPGSPSLYTISGKVDTDQEKKFAYVFAVNTLNGHTYSALTDCGGGFTIAILKPGDYRVFVKGYEGSAFSKPVSQSPSWYVSDGYSTNDPYLGTVFSLSLRKRSIKGITLRMIEQPVPFNLFWSRSRQPNRFCHSFLQPGVRGIFMISHINKNIVSLESYGSRPDYSLSNFRKKYKETYQVTIDFDPHAEEGERLVVARSYTGVIQAGLVGIHIMKKRLPDFIPRGNASTRSERFERQLQGEFDFTKLDPEYWK